MNIIHFTGNLGGDAETRTTQQGDKVTSFNVCVKNGYGRDAGSIWYRVSLWGKRGESLAPYLRKGGPVAVCGDLTFGEYQGKPQYEVRAHDVTPMGGKRDDAPARQESRGYAPPAEDLSDSIPF